jgi:hypothetical protein
MAVAGRPPLPAGHGGTGSHGPPSQCTGQYYDQRPPGPAGPCHSPTRRSPGARLGPDAGGGRAAFLNSKDGLLKCQCVGLESADFQMSPSDIE